MQIHANGAICSRLEALKASRRLKPRLLVEVHVFESSEKLFLCHGNGFQNCWKLREQVSAGVQFPLHSICFSYQWTCMRAMQGHGMQWDSRQANKTQRSVVCLYLSLFVLFPCTQKLLRSVIQVAGWDMPSRNMKVKSETKKQDLLHQDVKIKHQSRRQSQYLSMHIVFRCVALCCNAYVNLCNAMQWCVICVSCIVMSCYAMVCNDM